MTKRQVDIGDVSSMARELRKVGTETAADFQNLFSGVLIELHNLSHPRRILLVPVPLDFAKPFESMRLRLLGVVRSARIVIPLSLRFVLVRVAGTAVLLTICAAYLPFSQAIAHHRPAEPPNIVVPRVVLNHGLASVLSEFGAQVGPAEKVFDCIHKLTDVSGVAKHRTLVGNRELLLIEVSRPQGR